MKIDSSNLIVATISADNKQSEPSRSPLGIKVSSGNPSPQSGYWQLDSQIVKAVVNVKKGEAMPWQSGYPVNWILVGYDLGKE